LDLSQSFTKKYLFILKEINWRMKVLKISTLALSLLLIIAACKTKKKTTDSGNSTTATNSTTAAKTETTAAGLLLPARSPGGVNAPGNEELAAIQKNHAAVTMETLNLGYAVYTGTQCTGCHGSKNIYNRAEESWPDIINRMAKKAEINDVQKDAVLKYVLAVKATQPK
jgi:hypothetical protein